MTTAPDTGPRGEDRRARLARRGFLGAGGTAAVAGAAAAMTGAAGAGAAPAAGPKAGSAIGQSDVPGTTSDGIAWGDVGDPIDGTDPGEHAQETSAFFSTTFVEFAGTYAATTSDGDLWPNCWADDGNVYSANGDGRGFSDQPYKDVVVNVIYGTPETGITGAKLAESEQVANVYADPALYNRKPTGMACVNGVLYLAVQDLRYGPNAFDDVPNASISRSNDHGKTWIKTDTAMFPDYRFTTIWFCDFGKNSEQAKAALGARDGGYVYAYGLDWNWRSSGSGVVPDPVDVYLARVPDNAVQDRRKWQFFTGLASGTPSWSPRIEDKVPVLHDPVRRYVDTRPNMGGNLPIPSQGGVLYNAPLKRYIFSTWTDPSFEFYESPTPWGPWKRFKYHNTGLGPWYRSNDTVHTPKNGGYGTTIPSKFVSADGKKMWMQSNWWGPPYPMPEDNYNFNLRQVTVTPFAPSSPQNAPSKTNNLARSGADVTPYQVCPHYANWKYYSDGDRTKSEDSWDGTNKLLDFWGYTYSRAYRFSRVAYTTGDSFPDGGWFSAFGGGLRVQVRQNFRWVDVSALAISPDYPYDASANPFKTYTMRFRATWGDGIRIVGQPDGGSHFTSIAELEVYYDG